MKYLNEYKIFEEGKLVNLFRDEKIKSICKECNIYDYTINDDGSIDVDNSVNLCDGDLSKLPLKFNRVRDFFDSDNNQLTSLEGCPNYVEFNFYFKINIL